MCTIGRFLFAGFVVTASSCHLVRRVLSSRSCPGPGVIGAMMFVLACCPLPWSVADEGDVDGSVSFKPTATIDELFADGIAYVMKRDESAARAVVVELCRRKPELLLDSERQRSGSWNTFWFVERAKLREARLDPTDAAGRVVLARWLRAGGLAASARAMLLKALDIDSDVPDGKRLAEEWNLFGGGAVEFDLSYGLTHPLLQTTLRDENEEVSPTRGRVYLLLPFRYRSPERTLNIYSSRLHVLVDGEQRASCRGIMLLVPKNVRGSSGELTLELQPPGDPWWEQLQWGEDRATGKRALTCLNRRSRRSGGGRGNPGRQTKEPSGYAVFIAEVPEDFQTVRCVYADIAQTTLRADWLDEFTPASLDGEGMPISTNALAEGAASRDVPVALASIDKLSRVREAARGEDVTPTFRALGSEAMAALVRTWTHPIEPVSSRAIRAIALSPVELNADDVKSMLGHVDERAWPVVTEFIEQVFTPSRHEPKPPGGARREEADVSGPMANILKSLPVSTLPQNVFYLLGTCLARGGEALHGRLVAAALQEGSRQSIEALNESGIDVTGFVSTQLDTLDSPEVRSAAIRLMLVGTPREQLSAAIRKLGDAPLVILSPQDPVLKLLSPALDAETFTNLCGLLAKADFTAVERSDALDQDLEAMAANSDLGEQHRAALVLLAMQQFNPPYRSPMGEPLANPSSVAADLKNALVFERLLASLITESAPKSAGMAAVTLLGKGRVSALAVRLLAAKPLFRQDVIRDVAQSAALQSLDALPVFLAMMTASDDEKTIELALTALVNLGKRSTGDAGVRYDAALRSAVDMSRLAGHAVHRNELIVNRSRELLVRLAKPATDQRDTIMASVDAASVDAALRAVDEHRRAELTGRFGCILVVEFASTIERTGTSSIIQGPRLALSGSTVAIEPAGQTDVLLRLDGTVLGRESKSNLSRFQIDALPLLADVLSRSKGDDAEMLAQLDFAAVKELPCPLTPGRFGTWSGQTQPLSSRTALDGGDKRFTLRQVHVFLEMQRPGDR